MGRTVKTMLVVLAAMGACSCGYAIVIDDFSVGPIQLVRGSSPVTFVQSGLDPTRVIGGERAFVLGAFGAVGQRAEVDLSTTRLTLWLPPDARELGYLTVTYGGADHPLNRDLTAGGNDRFILDFDGPAPPGWLRVTSPGGASARSLSASPTLLFSDFEQVDFTSVTSITLDAIRSGGFSLNSITVVPEPAAGAGVIGLAMVAALGRRAGGG